MMTPLGSAGGLQERVRVAAVSEAIRIAGGLPGAKKYNSIIAIASCYIMCAAYHPPVF